MDSDHVFVSWPGKTTEISIRSAFLQQTMVAGILERSHHGFPHVVYNWETRQFNFIKRIDDVWKIQQVDSWIVQVDEKGDVLRHWKDEPPSIGVAQHSLDANELLPLLQAPQILPVSLPDDAAVAH